jgi:ribosomal protein S20
MRIQNRRLRVSLGVSLGVAALVVVATAGCGKRVTTPDEQLPNEFAGAPNWVLEGCSAYWGDDDGARLCGVGDAKIGRSMSVARTKATSRGRAEISRTLETKVKNMIKDFQEQVADGEAEMTAEQFSSTSVSLSKSTLNGTAIQNTWISPTGQLYILVALDIESFENSLREMDEMSSKLRTFIEARARKSFAELDEQMEDY